MMKAPSYLIKRISSCLIKRKSSRSYRPAFEGGVVNPPEGFDETFQSIHQQKGFKRSISKQNEAGWTLAKPIMVKQVNRKDNCVFSPLSFNIVLSFVAAGATGETQEQLLSFLKSKSIKELNSLSAYFVDSVLVDGSSSGGPRLSSVNGAWIDKTLSFRPGFKNVSDNVYKARTTPVDFKNKPDEARIEVNKWAENETNGLIKDLIPPDAVNELTRLILANALYFKGVWNQMFYESMTKEHDFHLLDGNTIKAPLMTSSEYQYIGVYDDFKVLRLPYQHGQDKGRRFSMYLYLPDSYDGLLSLVEKISGEPGFVERHLPRYPVPVGDFLIPKFKFSYGLEASEVLKQLGLVLPFIGGLDDMLDGTDENLCVSKIVHKSFIEVNEKGTKAAAATATVTQCDSCDSNSPEPEVNFVADHPFVFLIREDRTGSVLFLGSLVNPLLC